MNAQHATRAMISLLAD